MFHSARVEKEHLFACIADSAVMKHQREFYQPRHLLLSPVWQQKWDLHPCKGLREERQQGHSSEGPGPGGHPGVGPGLVSPESLPGQPESEAAVLSGCI